MRYYLGVINTGEEEPTYEEMCRIQQNSTNIPVTYEHSTIPYAAVHIRKLNIETTQENVWNLNKRICDAKGYAQLGVCNHIWYCAKNKAWYCLFGLYPDGKWPIIQCAIEHNLVNGLSLTFNKLTFVPYEITISEEPHKPRCYIIMSSVHIQDIFDYIRIHCPQTIASQ